MIETTIDPRTIELLAAKALPAASIEAAYGWLLRYTPGVGTRRANSVLPLTFGRLAAMDGDLSPREPKLAEAVDVCIAYYRARGLLPRFQVSPAATPPELDDFLHARGFTKEGASLALWAPIELPLSRLPQREDLRIVITRAPSPEWFQFYLRYGTGRSMAPAAARNLLLRIRGMPMFAAARLGDTCVGIGLGVHDDWLGLYSIATHPEYTRQGVASAVVRALCARAAINGADHVFLQVEAGNGPARALYDKAGFTVAYPYHYRALY